MAMRIAIGSDHAGWELKEEVKKYLSKNKFDFKDFGAYSEESCDYPEFAEKVCESVASDEYDRGILVCGAGIGMSIEANKYKGVYAALVDNTYSAEMSRKHNNANVLVLPGRIIGKGMANEILKIWLALEFEGGRHEKRFNLVKQIEKDNFK